VQIYGQVNRAILFWKDGIDSKTSFVDNNTSSTRLGLIGEGAIRPGLTVGSRFEMEFVWPSSSEIFDPQNAQVAAVTEVRYSTNSDRGVRSAVDLSQDRALALLSQEAGIVDDYEAAPR